MPIGSLNTRHRRNVLFQSESHPLVPEAPSTLQDHCQALIHEKAYEEAALLAADKAVLDVGCNNGYGSARISETARTVVGIDVSARAVDEARARYARHNLSFQVVDGMSLPFDAGMFDLVVSFQVLEHVVDHNAYLSSIRSMLTPGGTAIFTTPNREIRLDPGMKPINPFHVTEYSAGRLAQVLGAHFLRVEIRGLFGIPEVYAIEFNRVDRARRLARRRILWSAIRAARACLPSAATRRIARLVRLLQGPAAGRSLEVFPYSLDDLFYRSENLSSALDLMAICRGGPSD